MYGHVHIHCPTHTHTHPPPTSTSLMTCLRLIMPSGFCYTSAGHGLGPPHRDAPVYLEGPFPFSEAPSPGQPGPWPPNTEPGPTDTTGHQLHLWPGLVAAVGPGGQPLSSNEPRTSHTHPERPEVTPALHRVAHPPASPSPEQTCLQDLLSPDWPASKAGLFMGVFCWPSTSWPAEKAPCPPDPVRVISP